MAIRFVSLSTFSLPSPNLVGIIEIGKIDESLFAFASGAMIFLLIWSPMSGLPFNATISLKLAPSGIVIGAYGCPAYLSLTYLMNSNTST